jgi:hypothetical protein
MGNIYEFRRRHREAAKSETAELLEQLVAKEKRGELKGFLHIEDDGRATKWGMLGSFAGRYQFAGYTLIKALNVISDHIATTGTAGRTCGPGRREALDLPASKLPKRLREATGFGDLN